MRTTTLSAFGLLLVIFSCNQPAEFGSPEQIKKITADVDDQRLVDADKTPGDWLTNGRNYAEDRYSELYQLNKENIKNLGLAWSLNLGTTRGIEATPVVVNGIMYLSGPWSKVYAINAVTGELIWTYDPLVPGYYGRKACCDVVNVYPPPAEAKLIDLAVTAGKEQIQHGGLLFLQYCASCHSAPGDGGGSIPDLAYSSEGTFGILNDILLKGMYFKKGMANFSDKLNASDVDDIKNFVLFTAKEKAKTKK